MPEGSDGISATFYSERVRSYPTTQQLIAAELHKILSRESVSPEILTIMGSWSDTADDAATLAALKAWSDRPR